MPRGAATPRLLGEILDAGGDADCAVISAEERVTYERLRSRVRGIASALRHCGLQRGERVVILLGNGDAFPTAARDGLGKVTRISPA